MRAPLRTVGPRHSDNGHCLNGRGIGGKSRFVGRAGHSDGQPISCIAAASHALMAADPVLLTGPTQKVTQRNSDILRHRTTRTKQRFSRPSRARKGLVERSRTRERRLEAGFP
jgi:hypothetical protein